MKIKEITKKLEVLAPSRFQESYDNCGLIVGQEETELTSILFTLDVTEKVIDEAIEKGCNLILAHHPIIFFGLKKLNNKNYVERCVVKAIKNDIAIYGWHTPLDKVRFGVNCKIAQKITEGVENNNPWIMPLKEEKHLGDDCFGSSVGSGMYFDLVKEEFVVDFLERLKRVFDCHIIKFSGNNYENPPVKRIAVCGGAGASLIKDAKAKGCDLLITSDITYHQYFDAEGIVVADIGHYESEQFTKELMRDLILENIKFVEKKIKLEISKVNTNPVAVI